MCRRSCETIVSLIHGGIEVIAQLLEFCSVSSKFTLDCGITGIERRLCESNKARELDADDLLARTRALKALAADFHEVIEDEDGLELESYDGKLKIKVAGKSFRLDTDGDEGSSVVCDGHDLYSFDRAVSQVSVFSFDKVVQNSPFWLVIDPSPEVLAKFKISKAGAGSFNIKSEDQNVLYNVSFDKDGLSSIRYVDQNRQSALKNFANPAKKSVANFGAISRKLLALAEPPF